MVVVEYYIKGELSKHSRYFATRAAARNFCDLLKSDTNCTAMRIVD